MVDRIKSAATRGPIRIRGHARTDALAVEGLRRHDPIGRSPALKRRRMIFRRRSPSFHVQKFADAVK